MGILSALFGKRSPPPEVGRADRAANAELALDVNPDGFVGIRALDFFGQIASSPDGTWALCWRDGYGTRGGARSEGMGRYLLIDRTNNRALLDDNLERPNGGQVANGGTCSLEDWRFYDQSLQGRFLVIAPTGERLVTRDLAANLYNSGISENGLFAVCQTAHAPGEDGNRLIAFDVGGRRELFSVVPTTPWASSYAFDEAHRHVIVVLEGIGRFRYGDDGAFLDAAAYEAACLSSGRIELILDAANRILGEPDLTDARAALALEGAHRAVALCAGTDARWQALALKTQGLAWDALGDHAAAITAFEAALALDPKLGLKRRLQALKKQVDPRP